MMMADYKIKIALLQKVILDTGHHQRRISLADLRDNHSDGEAPLLSKRSGQMIRPVI